MRAVISFDTRGNGRALWTEAFPLATLGRLRVKRASSVEFNTKNQQWEVKLTGHKRASYKNASRANCIRWEVATLNQRLLNA